MPACPRGRLISPGGNDGAHPPTPPALAGPGRGTLPLGPRPGEGFSFSLSGHARRHTTDCLLKAIRRGPPSLAIPRRGLQERGGLT